MTEAATVDPRVRERRRAVQQAKERHRLRVALVLLSVPAAFGAGVLLLRSAAFDVDLVRVEGVDEMRGEDVREAAAVDLGAPLAFVDAGAVEGRVELLPWVADASVSIDWPGTLRVEVTEHRPAAFIRRAEGGVLLVASGGAVLGEAEVPPSGTVEITGVRRLPAPGDVLVPSGAAGVVGDLPSPLAESVATVDLGEAGVSLTLVSGPEIRLGTLADMAAKGSAALAVLDRLGGDDDVAYIDVSVPGAPVAGTDGGGALQPPGAPDDDMEDPGEGVAP